jgi:hypothetical protein
MPADPGRAETGGMSTSLLPTRRGPIWLWIVACAGQAGSYLVLLVVWFFALWGAYGDGPTALPNADLHAAEITVVAGAIAVTVAAAIGVLAGRARRRALMITEFSLGAVMAGLISALIVTAF